MAPTSCTRPVRRPLDPYLDQLAHLIDAYGITAFEGDIARLVVRLRAAGHCSPVVDVLADRTAAPVVRERAFGEAVGLLRRPAEHPVSAVA